MCAELVCQKSVSLHFHTRRSQPKDNDIFNIYFAVVICIQLIHNSILCGSTCIYNCVLSGSQCISGFSCSSFDAMYDTGSNSLIDLFCILLYSMDSAIQCVFYIQHIAFPLKFQSMILSLLTSFANPQATHFHAPESVKNPG